MRTWSSTAAITSSGSSVALTARAARPSASSSSSSSARSSANAASSASTSVTRTSSALKAGCGSERASASTPRMRPSRVRTGQERNDELLYQSHSRRAASASRFSYRRSCSPAAPGQSSIRSISTGLPVSTAASVTPARSGS